MNDIRKNNLNEIALETFKEGIYEAYKGGITSIAPLGSSGETIILYDNRKAGDRSRVSQVSLRNYCGDCELLITDVNGSFLFYGRLDCRQGLEFVAKEYFRMFKKVKKNILKKMGKRLDFQNINIAADASRTIGFEIMKAFI